MKTNIILTSPDRNLLGIQIKQETSTGFLNLSDLQDAYDSVRVQKGWGQRGVNTIMQTMDFKERLYYILYNQHLINVGIATFMEDIGNQGVTNYLKSVDAYKTTGRGENKTTWCNPYIWVLLAMEMNPEIYGQVVIWLTDKLIINRIEAGDLYKTFTAQLAKWEAPNYAYIAKLINLCVLGEHRLGIRQSCSSRQLKAIAEYEKLLASIIQDGFLPTEKDLIKYLEKKVKDLNL
jgi:hypothetical protein